MHLLIDLFIKDNFNTSVFNFNKLGALFFLVELHPFLPQPQLKKFCEEKG